MLGIKNSFIPVKGVGEKTEQKLWEAGVTTWDEFDREVVGPTRADHIEDFIRTAQDQLNERNAHYFGEVFPSKSYWRLYENFNDRTCFLDIETTGLNKRDDVTIVGLYQGGEMTTLIQGQNLSHDTLVKELQNVKLLITFNGGEFDLPFLERDFDIEIVAPHIDLIKVCRRMGYKGSLSFIERQVGIERDRPDLSGEDAVRLWREYDNGKDTSLDTLINYNREDVMNLERLMEEMTNQLHKEVFESVQTTC